jgi:hypothetical protein
MNGSLESVPDFTRLTFSKITNSTTVFTFINPYCNKTYINQPVGKEMFFVYCKSFGADNPIVLQINSCYTFPNCKTDAVFQSEKK